MKALFARHRLDIHASHLAFALSTMAEFQTDRAATKAEQEWSPAGEALACLSVRSAFHLLLSTLALPSGSEVLFSAVTHPDMPRLADHHGLRVLPVDLDRDTLAPRPELVLRALTPKTRMVVVAHLFGGSIDLSPLAEICRRSGLLLVEDCAQAFRGPEHTGDPLADVSLFSFGSLKTATALGGALATVRNADLLQRMRQLQAGWPVQRRRSHVERVVQMAAFVALTRPLPYALVAKASALAGADFDNSVNSSARAFPAGSAADLVKRLERRPCAPLLRLLVHRIRHFDHERIAARAAAGDRLAAMLPGGLHIGGAALDHTHWLFPMAAGDPDRAIAAARAAGFDAARRASSVGAIEAPADRPDLEPFEAKGFMSGLVFLPAYPELPEGSLEKLADAILGEVVEGAHPHPTLPLKGEGTVRPHSALSAKGEGIYA
jgi:perosamine synthetase